MMSDKKFISFLIPWLLLAVVMNITRFMVTQTHSYVYMNWNLFLALLPLLFVFLSDNITRLYIKAVMFFLWLVFLPNAAYIVTDFIHLRDVGPEWLLWFDGMMIFNYTLVGIFVSAYSLIKMKRSLFAKKVSYQTLFLVVISLLSSFGIYLGRYIRWNTWDIITHPINLAENIFIILRTEYGNPIFITSMIFFTLFIIASVYSLEYLFLKEKEV